MGVTNTLCSVTPVSARQQVKGEDYSSVLVFLYEKVKLFHILRGEMARQGIHMDQDKLCCSICLDLLKGPVTLPCGHNYCMNCIKSCWDGEHQKHTHSCPQCRHTFMDEHRGHDTVSAAAERKEKQRALGVSRQHLQLRIKEKEKEEVEAINRSADKAVKDSEKIVTDLIQLIAKRSSDLKQQIRSKQDKEVSRVRELQEKLQQELNDLRRKHTELGQLSHTPDHIQFLQSYPLLSSVSEPTNTLSTDTHTLRYFDDVTVVLSEVREELQDLLKERWTEISLTVTEADVLLPQLEPTTRGEFLLYSRQLTLDPNTAHTQLLLSEGNRKATVMEEKQLYPDHPDRFTQVQQVLSRESLTGRCYWEVEVEPGFTTVAVTYKDSRTKSPESAFGHNNRSWAVINSAEFIHNNIRTSISGLRPSRVGVYLDHRAGILSFYSVSETSETMRLLHRVQTTFTEPLYAGLAVCGFGFSVKLCELK